MAFEQDEERAGQGVAGSLFYLLLLRERFLKMSLDELATIKRPYLEPCSAFHRRMDDLNIGIGNG